ncbi:MAG: START domain-containing protein [Aureispira sp.]
MHLLSPFRLAFLAGAFLFLLHSSATAQTWTLAKNKNGVKIETRFLEGWSIKEYRATVYIKTTLEEAVEAYRDPVKRKSFMARSLEVSNLKEKSKNDIITYNLGKAPWPVSNRDNITHSIFIYSARQVRVTMESIPDYIPEKEGIVRVPRAKGYWLFTDQGNGTIKVVQQSVADLGGSVPDWVVNSTIVEGPYDVLLSLKRILE